MKSTAGVRFADKVHTYSRVRNSLTFINFPWVTFLLKRGKYFRFSTVFVLFCNFSKKNDVNIRLGGHLFKALPLLFFPNVLNLLLRLYDHSRTATDMGGKLHTDLKPVEISKIILISFQHLQRLYCFSKL